MPVTTLGRAMVQSAFPPGYAPKDPVTKKNLQAALHRVAVERPGEYARVAERIKHIGDEAATYIGLSVGLDDITTKTSERDRILEPRMKALRMAGEDLQRRREIIADVQKELLPLAQAHPSDMGKMVQSGGRGSVVQLMKGVVAVGSVGGRHHQISPWLIKHSFGEGLRPDEAWEAMVQARQDAVATKQSVSEPGAFGKIMAQAMIRQVITTPDCKTTNARVYSPDDPNILSRVMAQDAGGLARGTVIDERAAKVLVDAKVSKVRVRTPLTCAAAPGLCAQCYGHDEWRKFPPVGTNVGLRSAQAMAEPLTQASLDAKHGVRMTANARVSGLTGLSGFLDFPESFTSRAVLAPGTGKVTRIDAAPQGGHNLHMRIADQDRTIYVPPQLEVTARVGQEVDVGDALTDGIATPDDVVRLKDMGTGRAHVAESVRAIFGTMGVQLDPRHTELLARGHLSYVRVQDDPTGQYTPGEIVPFETVADRFKERTETVKLSDAKDGEVLAVGHEHWMAGTRLTPQIKRSLDGLGVKEVEVSRTGLKVTPVVHSITRTPLNDPSWLARMGHRYLQRSLTHAAQEGHVAPLHDTHPLAGYVEGTQFGGNHDGRY